MSGILIVTEEQKRQVRKNVNISEKQIQHDIEEVLDWFKKQQHLPRIELDTRLITNILLSRKGSVEQTKQKINAIFAVRNIIPELAASRDVLNFKIKNFFKAYDYVPLPKLNNDCTRINVLVYKSDKNCNLVDLLNFVATVTEYQLVHDYFSGERYIIDMSGFTVGHLVTHTPIVVKKSEIFFTKAFALQVNGLHIINGSNLINIFVGILKAVLSKELGSRIYVHPTYEDMYKVIDKEILPCDYGGAERSIKVLVDDWIAELSKEENRKYLIEQVNLRSNEALRKGNKLDNEILEALGSLKQLEFD